MTHNLIRPGFPLTAADLSHLHPVPLNYWEGAFVGYWWARPYDWFIDDADLHDA